MYKVQYKYLLSFAVMVSCITNKEIIELIYRIKPNTSFWNLFRQIFNIKKLTVTFFVSYVKQRYNQ